MKSLVAAGVLVVALVPQVVAQKYQSPLLAKDAIVTIKLPIAAIALAGVNRTRTRTIGTVEVTQIGAHYIPNGVLDWQTIAPPVLSDYVFEKIGTVDRLIEAEFRNNAFNLKFRFQNGVDPVLALSAFLIVGRRDSTEANAYRVSSTQLIAQTVFSGLPAISQEQGRALVQLSSTVVGGNAVGIHRVTRERYKDLDYFSITITDDGAAYNTIQMDEGKRAAQESAHSSLPCLR
jgi:hypothetical protein